MAEKTVRVADIETIIREMRDVEGAKVVVDAFGGIAEIHVLVKGERGPKQIVRDIESALMAKFALNIDHKKVSIAQMGSTSNPPTVSNGKKAKPVIRPELADLVTSVEGTRLKATVHLSLGGKIHSGSAAGYNTPRSFLRVLAQATISAVESLLEVPDVFVVDEVTQVKLSGDRTAINSLICLMGRQGEEPLLGAALVKQDLAKAVVHATLDALNRRFIFMLNGAKSSNHNGAELVDSSDESDGKGANITTDRDSVRVM